MISSRWCLLLVLPLAACQPRLDPDKGESQHISRALPFRDFDRLHLLGPDSAIVTVGPAFSVRAEGPEWAIAALDVNRSGGTLAIGRKRWQGPTGAGAADSQPVLLRVSMPFIRGATLTGSGGLTVDSVRGEDFTAMLTGSGNLTVPHLQVGRLVADVTGSGSIRLAGGANEAILSTQGSGSIAGERLKLRQASASVAGSGDIVLASDGRVNASILGTGDVTVFGNARCTASRVGAGRILCG